MNNRAVASTIASVQHNLEIAQQILREKQRAVASAKVDYFRCKDEYNKALLDRAYIEHSHAKAAALRAASALRIFAYHAKPALTQSGKVIRH
jgi:hypothetical protein